MSIKWDFCQKELERIGFELIDHSDSMKRFALFNPYIDLTVWERLEQVYIKWRGRHSVLDVGEIDTAMLLRIAGLYIDLAKMDA